MPQRKPSTTARGDGDAQIGLPPAPLTPLPLADTKRRIKKIMGEISKEDPATITDESPVVRANIPRFTLRSAVNRHFFPEPLHGIVDFPPKETVANLAGRINRTRDPQLP